MNDPELAANPAVRYEYKEVRRTQVDSGLICADLMVRASVPPLHNCYTSGQQFTLHPRYLLEELMASTGNHFVLAAKSGARVQLVHDGQLHESQVSTMKCSTGHNCLNVINMRTWWKTPTISNETLINPPVVNAALVCTNCGEKGHLVIHCAERVGYIRLIFTLSHIDANTVRNITAPRHFPETEPALLMLPVPPVLPADDLVEALFDLP